MKTQTVTAERLVTFALDALPSLRTPSGLYCFDRTYDDTTLRGESWRYSLMVLLGLERAHAAGLDVRMDLDELMLDCLARREGFTPGDIGLALWADVGLGGTNVGSLLKQLAGAIRDPRTVDHLVGMEIAWLVIGLARATRITLDAQPTLRRMLGYLDERRSPAGLYYHDNATRVRRHLPNFATEIYTVLALTEAARALDDNASEKRARVLADHLLRLQLSDGGWPWVFDADRVTVIERYEIYSVHQDAMAPMALLELTALTGDSDYAEAARAGLAWSRGNNELDFDLIDEPASFAHRSIRRTRSWGRAALGSGAAASVIGRGRVRIPSLSSPVEINQTCRPYHLGWILEAWAGREHLSKVGE